MFGKTQKHRQLSLAISDQTGAKKVFLNRRETAQDDDSSFSSLRLLSTSQSPILLHASTVGSPNNQRQRKNEEAAGVTKRTPEKVNRHSVEAGDASVAPPPIEVVRRRSSFSFLEVDNSRQMLSCRIRVKEWFG